MTSASSAGCHRILREFDGVCVTGAQDVRELLGWAGIAPAPAHPGSRDMPRVLDAASTRTPRDARELARGSGLSIAEVQTLVGLAEVAGALVRDGDGWRRTPTR